MVSSYFETFSSDIREAIAKELTTENTEGLKNVLIEYLTGIVSDELILEDVKPIDSSGFAPDGTDFIAYRKIFPELLKVMGGYVPFELVHGTFFLVKDMNKAVLADTLNRVSSVKKLGAFSQVDEESESVQRDIVPSFVVVCGDTSMSLLDIKNDVGNFYTAKSLDYSLEVDIIIVMGKGIVIKNWREKRSFIGLETLEDTVLWFFMLLNEYLVFEKTSNLDFRNYIKKNVTYKEY